MNEGCPGPPICCDPDLNGKWVDIMLDESPGTDQKLGQIQDHKLENLQATERLDPTLVSHPSLFGVKLSQ